MQNWEAIGVWIAKLMTAERKLILVWIVLFAVSALAQQTGFFKARTVSARAATLCVNPGGTGGCLASIQAAINAAANGDTINVVAGTYTEDFVINKSVALIGAGASATRLLGAPNNSMAEHISISAANVTIEGFTIDDSNSFGQSGAGANTLGIVIADVAGTVIRRNVITSVFLDVPTGGTAIYLNPNVKGALIEQNTVANSGNGILFDGTGRHDNFTIRKNLFKGNGRGTSSSRAAVRFVSADSIVAGHRNLIAGNNFTGNGGGGGIFNGSGVAVTAENNWWGCNFGPGAAGSANSGCSETTNKVSANVDATPWLTLRLSSLLGEVPPGGGADLAVSMLFNSDNVDTSANGGLSDSTQILFTATLGAVAPPSLNTTDGRAAAIFVAGAATGAATVAATVDGQTVSLVLSVSCPTGNCSTVGPGIALGKASPPSGARAGSVLIFNVYTSSTNLNLENTRISLTNIETSRAVSVHLFLVNGATGGVTDAFLCLTVGQTAGFLASDLDPNVTGYIIAVAVDSQGCPINFNYLIGDEYVKFGGGQAANLGAEAVTAIGNLPACAAGATATLNFDGKQYGALPHRLAVDSVASRSDGNDTLLILNRIGGNLTLSAAALGALSGVLYDDQEMGVVFGLAAGSCQFRAVLSNSTPRTNPRIDALIPAGRTGWMTIWPAVDGNAPPQAVTGVALNFNPNVRASVKAFNQGHNLHKLTVTEAATLAIPVLPPNC
ncbi:MAG TPA: hypothetical protein PKA34_28085 [Blastocatellia bacterium]|nr:hypothetical protein [Blastocatellia bacterium]